MRGRVEGRGRREGEEGGEEGGGGGRGNWLTKDFGGVEEFQESPSPRLLVGGKPSVGALHAQELCAPCMSCMRKEL